MPAQIMNMAVEFPVKIFRKDLSEARKLSIFEYKKKVENKQSDPTLNQFHPSDLLQVSDKNSSLYFVK